MSVIFRSQKDTTITKGGMNTREILQMQLPEGPTGCTEKRVLLQYLFICTLIFLKKNRSNIFTITQCSLLVLLSTLTKALSLKKKTKNLECRPFVNGQDNEIEANIFVNVL